MNKRSPWQQGRFEETAEAWSGNQGALFEPESSRGSVQTQDAVGFLGPANRKQGMKLTKVHGNREVASEQAGKRRESRKVRLGPRNVLWEPGFASRGLCLGLDQAGVAGRPKPAAELRQRKPLKGGRERPN